MNVDLSIQYVSVVLKEIGLGKDGNLEVSERTKNELDLHRLDDITEVGVPKRYTYNSTGSVTSRNTTLSLELYSIFYLPQKDFVQND